MVGGKYGMKRLKANTLQQLLAKFRLEAGALWSGECFPYIFCVYSSLWKARWINRSTHLSFQTMSTPLCALFFLRMVAYTSRTLRSVIQLTAYVRGSKSTRISLSFFRVQKTHLT
ncbi:hypothetical protein TNCV_857821 [Trichonephila clavipes]|nr:hypothetical protein TNCV_857821 [Trichonephila clavipes]